MLAEIQKGLVDYYGFKAVALYGGDSQTYKGMLDYLSRNNPTGQFNWVPTR